VRVSERVASLPPGVHDKFRLQVELRDFKNRTLAFFDRTWELSELQAPLICSKTCKLHRTDSSGTWTTIQHTFRDYGHGLSYIVWRDGGRDTEAFAGQTGPLLDSPELVVAIPLHPLSLPIPANGGLADSFLIHASLAAWAWVAVGVALVVLLAWITWRACFKSSPAHRKMDEEARALLGFKSLMHKLCGGQEGKGARLLIEPTSMAPAEEALPATCLEIIKASIYRHIIALLKCPSRLRACFGKRSGRPSTPSGADRMDESLQLL